MIVVVGGTGTLGRLVVADLLARGEQVRVVVRNTARATEVLGPDVEVVAADVRQPGSLDATVQGASTVVAAVHGFLGGRGAGPADVDRDGNAHLLAAAKTTAADVVLMSVIGAAPDSPLDLFRAKYAAEQNLRASGVPFTVVRSGPFLETWVGVMRKTAGKSGRPMVFGRGAQPIAFVSAVDVAAVVALAATTTTLRGKVLEVAGAPVTMVELARAVQVADGRTGEPRHLPRAMLRAMSILAGAVNPAFARQNQAALMMDTADLGDGDPHLRSQLGLSPARTPKNVLGEAGVGSRR
jgi:uncharacterized protein YbjT (DUF2867 family)